MKLTRRPLIIYILARISTVSLLLKGFQLLIPSLFVLAFMSALLGSALSIMVFPPPLSPFLLAIAFLFCGWALLRWRWFLLEFLRKMLWSWEDQAWQRWQARHMERARSIGEFLQSIAGQFVAAYEQYPLLCEETPSEDVWDNHTIVVKRCYQNGIRVTVAMRGHCRIVHLEYPWYRRSFAEEVAEDLRKDDHNTVVKLARKKLISLRRNS